MRMTDKLSELPAVRRENVGADDNSTISARLAQICYVLVCLKILFFCYIAVVDSDIYVLIVDEDGWIENLTVVAFLLAGIVLFVAALIERRFSPRCVYVLGGMAMMFFVGEEISWGQRIIGFGTPDFLVDLLDNDQVDLSDINIDVHHITGFSHIQKPAVFALCIAASAAFFCRKDRIFGIPRPPIFLTLAVLATMSYAYGGKVELLEILRFIESPHNGLLLFLLLFALFSQNGSLFITIAAPMSVSLAVPYLIDQNYYIDVSIWLEWHEYLFSVVCFFYALIALLGHGLARRKIVAAVAALKPAAALLSKLINPPPPQQNMDFFVEIKWSRLASWTVICLLIIAGSVGLAFATYIKARVEVAIFKEIYLLAQNVEPAARSNFDVYIDGRDLHYFKQPCDASDVDAPFFLGIFPNDVDVLPNNRRRHGFANRDFYFRYSNYHKHVRREYGYMLDGACIATARLPDYEIARVSTGQYVFGDDGVVTNLWIAEFPVGGE